MAILVHHQQHQDRNNNNNNNKNVVAGGAGGAGNSKNKIKQMKQKHFNGSNGSSSNNGSNGSSSNNGMMVMVTPVKVIWTLLVFVVGRQSTQYSMFRSSSSSSSSSAASLQRSMAGYYLDFSSSSTSTTSSSSSSAGTATGAAAASTTSAGTTGTEPERVVEEYSLALKESYGLLDQTTNAEWIKLKHDTSAKKGWYFDSTDPLKPDINNTTEWNFWNMVPNFDCPIVEKLGNPHKGESKFVCNPQRLTAPPAPAAPASSEAAAAAAAADSSNSTNCLIYSFGCAGDFQFEDSLVSQIQNPHKGCEIHVFDPASAFERPDDIPTKNIHYHAWGLRSSYDEESKSVVWPKGRRGGFKTFGETLEELGHVGRVIDILKIDCEGCEWSTVEDWIHLGIRQILIETHGVPSPDGTPSARWYQKPMHVHNDYYRFYEQEGYALFHKEINGLALELCFIKLHPDFWKSSGGGSGSGSGSGSGIAGSSSHQQQQQRRLLNESQQDEPDSGSTAAAAAVVQPPPPDPPVSVPAVDTTTTTISPEDYSYDDDIKLLIELTTRGNTSFECPPHLIAYHNRIVPSSSSDNSAAAAAATTEGKQKQKIPKIIHITERSRCVSPDMYHALKIWEQKFPSWSVFFHDDEAVDLLLNMEVWDSELAPHFHEILKCVLKGAMKIDIWRLIVSWRFGGMYSDNDVLPSQELNDETIHKDATFFALSDGWDRPSQWLFASTPKHPVFNNTMQILPRFVLDIPNIANPKVVFVTGPQILFNGYRNIFGDATKLELPPSVDGGVDNANNQDDHLMISPQSQEYGGNLITQRFFKRDKPYEMFLNMTYWADEVPCHRGCNNRTLISRKERSSIDAERIHWTAARGTEAELPSVSCKQHLTNLGHNYSVISSSY